MTVLPSERGSPVTKSIEISMEDKAQVAAKVTQRRRYSKTYTGSTQYRYLLPKIFPYPSVEE